MSEIIEKNFIEALSQRYLAYALSTIMSRSLPDVRDGLKPVHRRILFAMLQLKMDPKSAFKKCARVVGDVIGKYHPHGDVAVYDALTRLAQDFTSRYPLIEGQGNFGSIDGDNPAAMRYTESRLSEIALYLLKDIDEDTVEFKPTYDAQDNEPLILPASFPNLLANGSEGIAVGMATTIPPHNLGELCDALIALTDDENLSISEILNFIKGPDFPTGGIIYEVFDNLLKIYETGRGSLKIRAVWRVEFVSKGNYQIIIDEIPYQVQKAKLIEKMAELLRAKKLPLVETFYDDSAEKISIVIKPKNSDIEPEILMESLFKTTDLESKIIFNMNMVDSNYVPRLMNLKEILHEFLAHRRNIIQRRSSFRINKIIERLEILEALLVAYLNLDEVIRIIRFEDEPKDSLMLKFNLSIIQADAILNMRLKSLRKLEQELIIQEKQQLTDNLAKLEDILNNPNSLKKVIKTELKEIKQKFGQASDWGKRKTTIINESKNSLEFKVLEQDFIKEPLTLTISNLGWIKAYKGHNINIEQMRFKEGDSLNLVLECFSNEKIILFSDVGKFFTILANSFPIGKGEGDSLNLICELEKNENIISAFIFSDNANYLLVNNSGLGFIVNSNDFLAQTKNGKKVFILKDGEKAIRCIKIESQADLVMIISSNKKFLLFNLSEIPKSKKSQGVILQKYQNAKFADIAIISSNDDIFWSYLNKKRQFNLTEIVSKRGRVGKDAPLGLVKNGQLNFKIN